MTNIARAVREKLELVNSPNSEHLMPVYLSGGHAQACRAGPLDRPRSESDSLRRSRPPVSTDHAQTINELIIDLQAKLNVTSVVGTHDIHSAFSVGDGSPFSTRAFRMDRPMDDARDSDIRSCANFESRAVCGGAAVEET